MSEMNGNSWWIYTGTGVPHDGIQKLPEPPRWRRFNEYAENERHIGYRMNRAEGPRDLAESEIKEIEMVNAALYLRRPLLVSGKPGSGKSSLAYMVARELELGNVLHWPITTRSTVADALYQYDAIGRLQVASHQHSLSKDSDEIELATTIGNFIRLGPLGTALLPGKKPRVLLIDEIDKSDIDLPNDLLNVFEEGYFEIRELRRMAKGKEKLRVSVMTHNDNTVEIINGRVQCSTFPLVVLTSNGERDFPPAFWRRCLHLEMIPPGPKRLAEIIEAHFRSDRLSEEEKTMDQPGGPTPEQIEQLIKKFLARRKQGDLSADQLLNVLYMTANHAPISEESDLFKSLLRYLTEGI